MSALSNFRRGEILALSNSALDLSDTFPLNEILGMSSKTPTSSSLPEVIMLFETTVLVGEVLRSWSLPTANPICAIS